MHAAGTKAVSTYEGFNDDDEPCRPVAAIRVPRKLPPPLPLPAPWPTPPPPPPLDLPLRAAVEQLAPAAGLPETRAAAAAIPLTSAVSDRRRMGCP